MGGFVCTGGLDVHGGVFSLPCLGRCAKYGRCYYLGRTVFDAAGRSRCICSWFWLPTRHGCGPLHTVARYFCALHAFGTAMRLGGLVNRPQTAKEKEAIRLSVARVRLGRRGRARAKGLFGKNPRTADARGVGEMGIKCVAPEEFFKCLAGKSPRTRSVISRVTFAHSATTVEVVWGK